MTDPATVPDRNLTPFEGKDVLSAAIEIPNAAGGLREAMRIDPQEFHHGDKRYVVLELDCKKVRFDPVANTNGLDRVHVFSAVAATFVDEDLVREQLDEQARRIEAARVAEEQAKGIHRIPFEKDGEEAPEAEVLTTQHNAGVHADGLRDGCPLCQAEVEAEAKEKGEGNVTEPTPIANGRKGRGRRS